LGQGYAAKIARALEAWLGGCDDMVRMAALIFGDSPSPEIIDGM
jgi:hypothetical protein